jgi:rhodanese-related sulfurtransferase
VSEVEKLLEAARAGLDRVECAQLTNEIASGALVVDIRPEADRVCEGALPGAVVIERNVLEWRLDPSSPDRIPEANDVGRRIILVCNEGYASSLAAAALQTLGLSRATDLDGGYRGWKRFTS